MGGSGDGRMHYPANCTSGVALENFVLFQSLFLYLSLFLVALHRSLIIKTSSIHYSKLHLLVSHKLLVLLPCIEAKITILNTLFFVCVFIFFLQKNYINVGITKRRGGMSVCERMYATVCPF